MNANKRCTRGTKRKSAPQLPSIVDDQHHHPSPQSKHEIAKSLLSWLPRNAKIQNKRSIELLKAFDLVRAELQHRSNLMGIQSIHKGERSNILITTKVTTDAYGGGSSSSVSVPAMVMQYIFEFLPRFDVVHKISLVSKSWLALVRAPEFWTALDHSTGLSERSQQICNMTSLLVLLQKPQFASIKRLIPPGKVQARKHVFETIAKSCPLLEEMDVGWFCSGMKLDDYMLSSLPHIFPHLTSIGFQMDRMTSHGVIDFCHTMGERLIELRIMDSFYSHHRLTDSALLSIAACCPNLERFDFEYHNYRRKDEKSSMKPFAEEGAIALLKCCPKMKTLCIMHCLEKELLPLLEYITSNNNINLQKLFVVLDECVKSLKIVTLCNQLSAKIPTFSIVLMKGHVEKCRDLRRRGASTHYWYEPHRDCSNP